NNPSYATLVQEYRDKLTFWRNYYQDSTWDSTYECSLTNPQRLEHKPNTPLILLNIFPNPSSTSINVHFISSQDNESSLRIVNAIGDVVYAETITNPHTEFYRAIS